MTDLNKILQQVSVFSDLPPQQIQWLVDQGKETRLNPGEILRHEGDEADSIFVLISGQLRIYQNMENHELVLATYNTLDFFGELPILTGEAHYWASGRAIVPCHIFELTKANFWQLLSKHPTVTMRVLNTMTQRMQDVQSLYKQQEKLTALGTLAAGLAHEMNNPATAALRSAQELKQLLPILTSYGAQPPTLAPDEQHQLATLHQTVLQTPPAAATILDPLTRSDREDELVAWLEERAIANPWTLAPALVSAGLAPEKLDHLTSHLTTDTLVVVLQWLTHSLNSFELLHTIHTSITRVSELVTAIKDYSFMDQAPLQTIDIHHGLESTLTILSYRLKQKGITIQRHYTQSVPLIQAYGSELNQVWTYLIDNAIDVLSDSPTPTIELHTNQEVDHLLIEISDNGPGIPLDIQPRIFEPFFTTKEVGKGTGLGLDMTYRIIKKHSGDIYFTSSPGETRFYVRLPINGELE
ncbi:MAG: ATP-binding protein [Cyanobacteria bacterium P01_H01_bin.21]